MAIALEFIDFVVPLSVIREKYLGGWEQCLTDHQRLIGGRVWYDNHLLRDGAMNPMDIKTLLDEWVALGFEPTENIADRLSWKDCCVIESLLGGPTLPCSWIEIGGDSRSAYLKGTEPGTVVGRSRT